VNKTMTKSTAREGAPAKTVSPEVPYKPSAEEAKVTSQVDQVRSVIADAVSKISASFSTLREESDSQRQMMDDLMSTMANQSAGPGGRKHLSVQAFARETGAILQQFTEMLAAVSEESVRTVRRIDEMAGQFDAVFRLVEQVNDISHATFVLAVNASIQAANAKGDHGHSFAVIASNVRDLSKKTQRFNNEIGDQVQKARATISDARKSMSELASRDLAVATESRQRVQDMLEDVTVFENFTRDTIERANDAAIRIAGAASQAVTALQFEDICEQILSNVKQRVQRLDRHAAGDAARQELLRDPVHQTSVAPGEVDLF
jgi:methyl-accepting chemotaxis protein